jgi:uncharacterized protein (DUF1800 family)
MNKYSAEIAANRFGMGARAGELQAAQEDPVNWLLKQIKPIAFDSAVGNLAKVSEMLKDYNQVRKNEKLGAQNNQGKVDRNRKNNNDNRMLTNETISVADAAAIAKPILPANQMANDNQGDEKASPELKAYRKKSGDMIMAMQMEVLRNAITTPDSLSARLLDFFSNHFSVSGQGVAMRLYAPLLEREAIAPHLSGQFVDMLLAVEQHPAMLTYLNNEKSIGPDSPQGKKAKKGLNENLGREILELHTLGVNTGYTQTDVRELAMAITGWSLIDPKKVTGPKDDGFGFMFRERTHQPGTRKVLNKKYSQAGVAQGEAILKDLAIHPATAQHISFKLARHFVADKPSETLVAAMKKTWLATQGDISAVMKTMIEHSDAWVPAQQKYKTPREFVVSVFRVLDGVEPVTREKLKLVQGLRALGQEPFNAGSPAGYGDTASNWDGAEALMARIEWANQLAAHIKTPPVDLITAALGKQLSENSLKLIKRAESRQQGLVLALMSPEFQRR